MLFLGLEVTVVVALIVLAAFEVFWPLTVVLLGLAAVGWQSGNLWTALHQITVARVIIYLAIGLGWTFFRWTRFVEEKFREAKKNPESKYKPQVPSWSDKWDDYTAVFFYWPLDALAYLLSDFLQNVWKHASTFVMDSFDRYAKWRFAALEKK